MWYWITAVSIVVTACGIGCFFWPERKYKPPVWHD